MRQNLFFGFVIVGLVTTVLIPAAVQAAAPARESATLKQMILPSNCKFETVNDGLNTIVYLTPAACVPIVTPDPANPSPGSPSNPANPSQPGKPAVTPGKSNNNKPLIAARPDQSGATNLFVLPNLPTTPESQVMPAPKKRIFIIEEQVSAVYAQSGDVYRYQLAATKQRPLADRELSIVSVGKDWVTLLLQPLNQLISLKKGQTSQADYDEAGRPHILVTVEDIASNAQVKLRIEVLGAFASQKPQSPITLDHRAAVRPIDIGLIIVILIGGALWATRRRHRND